MKLTPLDVKKQEFRKTLRGFDPIEVQTFLEMVAEEYERVLEENKQIGRKVIELETRLKDFQETEKNLRETLLNVQEVKKQSEESSRRQAGLLVKEAELKSLEIIENARKQARKMRDEVNILQTQKESFINRLRQILISQIELLSVLEIDDAIPEEAHEYIDKVKHRKRKNMHSEQEKMLKMETQEADTDEGDEEIEFISSDSEKKTEANDTESSEFKVGSDFIEPQDNEELEETSKPTKKKNESDEESHKDEINEFFKKGIQIDELIKNLDKKEKK